MVAESGIHGGAAGANLGVKHLGKFEKHIKAFLAAHSVTSRDHD